MIADTDEASGYKQVINMTKEYGPNKAAFIEINPANYVLLKSIHSTTSYNWKISNFILDAFISTINYYKGLDIVINNIKFREKNWEDQVDENIVSWTVLCGVLSKRCLVERNSPQYSTVFGIYGSQ